MLLLGIIPKKIIQKKEKAIYIIIVTIIAGTLETIDIIWYLLCYLAHMISNSKKPLRNNIIHSFE